MHQPDRNIGQHDNQLNDINENGNDNRNEDGNEDGNEDEIGGFISSNTLGFSLIDDDDNLTNLDTNAEFLDSNTLDNENKSINNLDEKQDYKSDKRNGFDNDYERLMKDRGADNNNSMNMRTF